MAFLTAVPQKIKTYLGRNLMVFVRNWQCIHLGGLCFQSSSAKFSMQTPLWLVVVRDMLGTLFQMQGWLQSWRFLYSCLALGLWGCFWGVLTFGPNDKDCVVVVHLQKVLFGLRYSSWDVCSLLFLYLLRHHHHQATRQRVLACFFFSLLFFAQYMHELSRLLHGRLSTWHCA